MQGNITKIPVEAMVSAANASLLGGGGVDGAIHRAGGAQILEDCRRIVARQGGCATGEAVITGAGNLPAQYVIHTVGPVWNGGDHAEDSLLENAYRNCFRLAAEHHIRSLSFPNISTRIYRFPKSRAVRRRFRRPEGAEGYRRDPGAGAGFQRYGAGAAQPGADLPPLRRLSSPAH